MTLRVLSVTLRVVQCNTESLVQCNTESVKCDGDNAVDSVVTVGDVETKSQT